MSLNTRPCIYGSPNARTMASTIKKISMSNLTKKKMGDHGAKKMKIGNNSNWRHNWIMVVMNINVYKGRFDTTRYATDIQHVVMNMLRNNGKNIIWNNPMMIRTTKYLFFQNKTFTKMPINVDRIEMLYDFEMKINMVPVNRASVQFIKV
eukprot:553531_1